MSNETTSGVRSVSIKVTWSGVLPHILSVLENGKGEGRKIAIEELTNMAKAADLYNESIEDKK